MKSSLLNNQQNKQIINNLHNKKDKVNILLYGMCNFEI